MRQNTKQLSYVVHVLMFVVCVLMGYDCGVFLRLLLVGGVVAVMVLMLCVCVASAILVVDGDVGGCGRVVVVCVVCWLWGG